MESRLAHSRTKRILRQLKGKYRGHWSWRSVRYLNRISFYSDIPSRAGDFQMRIFVGQIWMLGILTLRSQINRVALRPYLESVYSRLNLIDIQSNLFQLVVNEVFTLGWSTILNDRNLIYPLDSAAGQTPRARTSSTWRTPMRGKCYQDFTNFKNEKMKN